MADFILRWRDRKNEVKAFAGSCFTTNTTLNGGPYPSLTYHVRNLQSFSIDLDTPVCIIRLPEEGSNKTFTIKTQGNALTMNLSWTLHENMCLPAVCTLVDEFDGFCCRLGPVLTVCSQLDFLVNTMENTGLCYEWDLYVGDSDFNGGASVTPGAGRNTITEAQAKSAFEASTVFRKSVKITKIVLSKSGGTPVTYVVNMSMIAGDRLLTVDETTEVTTP